MTTGEAKPKRQGPPRQRSARPRTRRSRGPARRLIEALERRLAAFEMETKDRPMTDDDVKQITQMAKTLESLNGLARAEEARGTQAEESDLDAIRARLQDRLDRLRSGGGETLRGNADG